MEKLICTKCNCELEMIKAHGEYLGFEFEEEILGCPECGQVYVSEDFVNSKITDIEATLEIK